MQTLKYGLLVHSVICIVEEWKINCCVDNDNCSSSKKGKNDEKETFYIFHIYKEFLIKSVYSGDSLNGDYCK